MERLKLDYCQLNKAIKTLQKGFNIAIRLQQFEDVDFDLVAEDSIIKRFEYTYETFWKFLKRYLETAHKLEDINSPKKVFRACVKTEVCTPEQGDILIDMSDDRNETSHSYNIEASRIILVDIPRYCEVMVTILKQFEYLSMS